MEAVIVNGFFLLPRHSESSPHVFLFKGKIRVLHAFYQVLGHVCISPTSFVNTDEIFMKLLISIHDNLSLRELIIEVRLLA